MTYAIVRAGLIELLQGATGFDDGNVTYEDWERLNAGSGRAIVVEYAGFTQQRESFQGGDFIQWDFDVNLYNQAIDSVNSQDSQDADRESIIQRLRKYPKLDGTAGVFVSEAQSGQPAKFPTQLGSAHFLKETIRVQVTEDVQTEELE